MNFEVGETYPLRSISRNAKREKKKKNWRQCGLVSDGTLREYLPEAKRAFPDAVLADVFRRSAAAKKCRVREATVWTTDALYRETPEKVTQWRAAGGEIVNMDTAYF
jgi:hypothetical protein